MAGTATGGATLVHECVHQFVADVAATLDAIMVSRGNTPGDHTFDAAAEAFAITCACIDADSRRTDAELIALATSFGSLLPKLGMDPFTAVGLRDSDLITSRAGFLKSPGPLFQLLIDADRLDGTVLASIYYQRAMDLAHAVAALDEVPAQAELASISAYRTMMLGAMGRGGLARPAVPTQPGLTQAGHAPAAPAAATPSGAPAGPPEHASPEPLEVVLAELDALVGLTEIKREVRQLADLLRINQLRTEHDLPITEIGLHMVFVGNPGTGKTTVARLLARVLRSLGALSTGQLIETDRTGLVAGFVGQTAPLVQLRFDEANGGVLFVDEAYTLARGGGNDFGREAIDTMVKLMEDRRTSVVVVVAGYIDEMGAFIASNPGLRSRFTRTLTYPDYTTDELMTIFERIAGPKRYEWDASTAQTLRTIFDAEPRTLGFGNGRYARNLFEAAITQQASRLVQADTTGPADLVTLTSADLIAAADVLAASRR